MKRLILLRHGKSSWSHHVADVDRPLLDRAYHDAELVAEAFQLQTDYRFTLWSSKANRAKTTAELIYKQLENRVDEFQIKSEFYTFDANELLQLIYHLPNHISNLMLVGHNPAFTQILNFFCEEANVYNLPTTGLAELLFDVDEWKTVSRAKMNLLLFPKNLKNE